MGKVQYTKVAEIDLLQIWEHISLDDEAAADRFLDSIEDSCNLLALNPQSGRLRLEFGRNIRSIPIGNYLLFYRPRDMGITILRVLHGARDLTDLL